MKKRRIVFGPQDYGLDELEEDIAEIRKIVEVFNPRSSEEGF